MKIQRKLLTTEQKYEICTKYYDNCEECPLYSKVLNHFCIYNLDQVRNAVNEFLNEEIEINDI